jgi:hypothetical protein
MAYIKKKKIKGRIYYYLAESYREGGKVKTRTLRYLGTEPPDEVVAGLSSSRTRKKMQLTKIEKEVQMELQDLFGGYISFRVPE